MNDVQQRSDFDVVIAGGGMIGASLALAMAPLGLRVAMVEPVVRSAGAQPSFDDRSTALSRSTQRMLEAVGIWPEVEAAATAIRHIHVSDKGRFGFAHIDAEEQRVEALGWVVINRVFGEVLGAHLDATDAVERITPGRIVGTRLTPDARVVVIEEATGQRELRCSLLVAADGARSSVRDMLAIGGMHKSYEQTAIIGNLQPGDAIAGRAFERFTPDGALAMLPIAEGRAAFVWITSSARAADLLADDDAAFLERLQAEFGNRLGRFSRVGRRDSYPLALTRANSITAKRAVLVGNAAHGLHPVAAQGFNLGMRDVATLCDCLLDNAGSDPGNALLLERYAGWRRDDQRKLLGFTDGLVQLFGVRRGPMAALRDVGMLGFDLLPGVRKQFARHTMGLAGKLPRLSRGVALR